MQSSSLSSSSSLVSDQLHRLLELEDNYLTTDYLLLDMHCYHNSHSNTTTNNNNNTNKPIPHLRHRTTTSTEQQHAIHWRKKICEWSYQVADHFDLSRDIVYVAMNYVDRYCSGGTKEDADDDDENVAVNLLLQDKNRYQLLAMASLCLAIKLYGEIEFDPQEQEQQDDQYHHQHHHHHQDSTTTCTSLSAANHVDEILPTPDENGIVVVPPELRRTGDAKPSLEDEADEAKRRTEASVSVSASVESWIVETIVRLGRNYFTQEQLQGMELEVLANLGWYLHPPTPQLVLEYYFHEFCHHHPGCAAAAAAPNHNNLEELALFLIELSVHDYYFVATQPSILALAALLNAAQLLLIQQQDNDDDEEEEDGHHNPVRNTNINNDAGNVELSMSWITNVQHYLLLYNRDTDDNGKCNTVATAATTATKEEEISSCRMRLHQLYTNTNATMDDFGATTQHHQPYTDRAGDGENNNGDDLVECNREPSPTSVTHDVK